MTGRRHLLKAILKRDLSSYFSSPTGYVFITLFVFLSAIAAFWQEAFFSRNLANLDQLNSLVPYLLVLFVPTITMGIWAQERNNGTDELLLTLPATDFEIVMGKYLASLTIYSVALIFSLSHVVVLSWLGNPDPGLMFSTYLGYWLMGAALLALGMTASLLTDNLTIAFIGGALLCAVPVFIDDAGTIMAGRLKRVVEGLSLQQQFQDLASGVVTLSALVYFVAFAASMLYLNVSLLGRRHWPSGRGAARLGWHTLARALALIVAVGGATLLMSRLGGRFDVTSEQTHSLSSDTRKLIAGLDSKQPVFIQAYLSPDDVPRGYLQIRNNIITLLREFQALGRGRLQVRIVETEKYSPAAREAQERFNMRPWPISASQQTPGGPGEIYMGLAFSSGPEESVIPFFDPGLPVEYELVRSIRVVAHAKRKRVGILQTPAGLIGGYDFESRVPTPEWSIVAELRKQYDVTQVAPGMDYPDDLDVLIAVLPTTLEQDQVGRLTEYVKKGRPVLVVFDPLPSFNPQLSPQQIPFSPLAGEQQQRPPADIKALLDALGIEWPTDRVVWDKYNPHPQFRSLPPEVVFVGPGNKSAMPFNQSETVSSGLQELVMIDAGNLKPVKGSGRQFIPLVQTGRDSGAAEWARVLERSMFGGEVDDSSHSPDGMSHVLAARIRGVAPQPAVNAIVLADADMMGEQFFQMRRVGLEDLQFDNVTFLLNAVDHLAGDDSFISLRKRRPRHRTLESVEARTRVYEEQRVKETREAEQSAEKKLKEAQARLDKAVGELQKRGDLDEQTKGIMVANLEKGENRRLDVTRTNIEEEKQRMVERSRGEMELSIRRIENTIKILAVVLPPIPAFLLFVFVSVRRLRRERAGLMGDRVVSRREAFSR